MNPTQFTKSLATAGSLLILTACSGGLNYDIIAPAPTATAPDSPEVEAQGIEEAATGEEPAGAVGATAATEETLPTPAQPVDASPLAIWPLEADLYLLDENGHIWRQPLFGNEDVAATIAPTEQVVLDFDIAPGGGWVMYRTAEFVGVTSLDGRSGQVIAFEESASMPDQPGQTVSWSPDGSKMALATAAGFQVYIPGQGAEFGPLVFDTPEAQVADLGWSQHSDWLLVWRADRGAALYEIGLTVSLYAELGQITGYTWLSDGRLAFAPAEGGLALLNPADLSSRTFMVPQDRQVTLPGERLDRTLAFFVHGEGIENPGFLHVGNPQDMSFSPVSAVPVQTVDLQWNPTTTRLIGPDPNSPFTTTVLVLDPATGSQATFEAAAGVDRIVWGERPPESVPGVNLPADLYFLALQAGIVQVWRLPANGDPPQTITGMTEDVVDYDISPDGTQLVYTSGGIVYRAVINTNDITQIAALDDEVINGTPAWSPNGRQVAYANNGIWIYDLDTLEERQVAVSNVPEDDTDFRLVQVYGEPQWSPDGQWLAARVGFYEGSDHALIVTNPEIDAEPIPLELFAARVKWLPNGRLLAYSEGGAYTLPMLTLVTPTTPGEPPGITRLLDVPVKDVQSLSDGLLAMLRVNGPFSLGPTSAQVFTALPDGTDLSPASEAFVLEDPILAPDASLAAGVIQTRITDFSLAVVNPVSGQVQIIEGISNPRRLQWGP
jgi:WD40 repeat protein